MNRFHSQIKVSAKYIIHWINLLKIWKQKTGWEKKTEKYFLS